MKAWFEHTVVDTGRLPLFFLLVAFLLTFLFIRFSVRMIRAEVSWWPGNVTPGGMHIHHMVFGLMMMLVSGFAFIALADFHTPVANCVLASVFGIGSALVLDEYALVLHLRDVYWAEEGRSSIDAVFVAIAISFLFLFGVHPIGFAGEFDPYEQDRSIATLIAIIVALILQLALAMITLLKGKLWTGLIGLFFPPLLIVGAIRLSRPGAPWARSRYRYKPVKLSRAVAREQRVREPLIKAKIRFQESVSGSFGVPEAIPRPAAEPATASTPEPSPTTPKWRISDALRWRRTRRRLRTVPVWRLPVLLVVAAFFLADTLIDVDSSVFDGFGSDSLEYAVDPGATATLLSVIAGGMITLTGLVFTAITLAMQFGASQISVRVVPMLAQQRVMRWSIGMFLATFVYSIIVALDLALNTQHSAPQISTYTALFLAIISAILFIALVSRVGSILNSSRLLRWIAAEGRSAIVRSYPHYDESAQDAPSVAAAPVTDRAPAVDDSADLLVVRLRHLSPNGRILLAINLPRLERLASKWGVSVEVVPGIGEFVAQNAPLFEVRGTSMAIRPDSLMSCLIFGDTHGPVVGPAAAIQSIVDIALKALSPAINDPGRAVQALDHIEDLLVLLAPRVHADSATSTLTRIRGQERTWTDYVSIATDEIRHFSTNSAQVQRRLRAVLTTLLTACPADQHAPLLERLDAMNTQLTREWTGELDIRLAGVADPQGLGSEAGASGRVHPLIVGRPAAK
ncbi:DUF2254 domain-containing protein [Rhodococcus sp. KBS0724]|uniref:DUF2254 domain-containing protein n=1 Tax=Rhodococcus sp. KBS0724 TaxID=1179674 RepID=UPI00110E7DCA|nr:DUF2254 domain-containing protein [Rhodococcus sp. KBS0724]TSD47616.1 DUF2254 domain-containing protein [Rhodococcus sp. KBS0724]